MAAGIITTGNFPAALEPNGLHWFLDAEKLLKPAYAEFCEVLATNNAYDRDRAWGGLGDAKVKPENTAIHMDTMVQGKERVYTSSIVYNAFQISHEMVRDGDAARIMQNRSVELRKSLDEKKEQLAADLVNNGFTPGYNGYDGVTLYNASHPTQGASFKNRPSIDSDLTEVAAEQAVIDITTGFRDLRGRYCERMPVKVMVPPALDFDAKRLFESPMRPGVPDNDLNALKDKRSFPGGYMVVYRLDSSAVEFAVLTDARDGFKIYQRENATFRSSGVFQTMAQEFLGYEAYAIDFTNPQISYASPGA